MKKYYFIFCRCEYVSCPKVGFPTSGTIETTKFIDIHPIQWQINCNEKWGEFHTESSGGGQRKEDYMVLHWQEVTKEEYDEYEGMVG